MLLATTSAKPPTHLHLGGVLSEPTTICLFSALTPPRLAPSAAALRGGRATPPLGLSQWPVRPPLNLSLDPLGLVPGI